MDGSCRQSHVTIDDRHRQISARDVLLDKVRWIYSLIALVVRVKSREAISTNIFAVHLLGTLKLKGDSELSTNTSISPISKCHEIKHFPEIINICGNNLPLAEAMLPLIETYTFSVIIL